MISEIRQEPQEIYVYGCGGVGSELAEHLSNDPRYRFMGFIDDNPEIRNYMGFESYTFEEILAQKAEKLTISVIISIGEPAIREELSKKIMKYELQEITVDLSEHFDPAFSKVEPGTLLHKGSYISVNSHIGKCCMINKGVLVGHGCTVGSYSVLAPHVTLGGDVIIGDNTYIGTGASIRNGINIGNNVIVGMGAVVVSDVEDEAVVIGNPAKFVRRNEKHRVFEKIITPPLSSYKKQKSLLCCAYSQWIAA